ncbi:hypothetical protein QJ857_gp0419 [Tupanvirus soda lake]|uniref:Uncharacterized protein n=2 Tax=Tupanvirus TaxID=2094720 RepID=A0A6N1NW44_9VIRU|nr:hypothetical protein QJ857_gp0419 [Tupanvirus soda lake]QKU35616.1 hypothetical protein [Tupanvirus soda lake]
MKQQQFNNESFRKKQAYTIVSSPSINSMVNDLVALRCANDVALKGPARHACTIFVEKNQSCFKPSFNRYQSRKLCIEKEKRRKKLPYENARFSIRKQSFMQPSLQQEIILYREVNTCRRNGN